MITAPSLGRLCHCSGPERYLPPSGAVQRAGARQSPGLAGIWAVSGMLFRQSAPRLRHGPGSSLSETRGAPQPVVVHVAASHSDPNFCSFDQEVKNQMSKSRIIWFWISPTKSQFQNFCKVHT
jgi:hypothetical protein